MRVLKTLVLLFGTLLTCGCTLPCFRAPLYSDDLLTDEPSLEGRWLKVVHESPFDYPLESSFSPEMQISRTGKGTYDVACDGDHLVARVIRLEDLILVDLEVPEAVLRKTRCRHSEGPVHEIVCIAVRNGRLGIAELKMDQLDLALKKTGLSKTELPAREGETWGLRLVEATTAQLQTLIREHGGQIFDTSRSAAMYKRTR